MFEFKIFDQTQTVVSATNIFTKGNSFSPITQLNSQCLINSNTNTSIRVSQTEVNSSSPIWGYSGNTYISFQRII